MFFNLRITELLIQNDSYQPKVIEGLDAKT